MQTPPPAWNPTHALSLSSKSSACTSHVFNECATQTSGSSFSNLLFWVGLGKQRESESIRKHIWILRWPIIDIPCGVFLFMHRFRQHLTLKIHITMFDPGGCIWKEYFIKRGHLAGGHFWRPWPCAPIWTNSPQTSANGAIYLGVYENRCVISLFGYWMLKMSIPT